ncbi:hypothetical protein D3C87_2133130 [compost metagenome]
MATNLHIEQRSCMFGTIEHIARRLVDRYSTAPESCIGALACMQRKGVKLVVGHEGAPKCNFLHSW